MMQPTPAVAAELEQRATDIAAAAAAHLVGSRPEIRERFGADALAVWQEHLQQRLLELSAGDRGGAMRTCSCRG